MLDMSVTFSGQCTVGLTGALNELSKTDIIAKDHILQDIGSFPVDCHAHPKVSFD